MTREKELSGKEFKRWLIDRGLSYEDLARASDIPYTTVARWSRGTQPRSMAKRLLKRSFPDCPLVRNGV